MFLKHPSWFVGIKIPAAYRKGEITTQIQELQSKIAENHKGTYVLCSVHFKCFMELKFYVN